MLKMKFAEGSDAPVIYDLMMRAFSEYQDAVPPSSALKETVESISMDMENGGQAINYYVDDQLVGMVRFRMEEHSFISISWIQHR